MNAPALKAKIDDAKRRLLTAEKEMERALHLIETTPRGNKSIIGSALGISLSEMKAARLDLIALEKVIADAD